MLNSFQHPLHSLCTNTVEILKQVQDDTRKGFTLIEWVGQALPANAPAKGHRAAFTLIELLVVVLIIGILAAVAVPQYQKAVYKARTAEAITMVKALAQAQQVYYLANGDYTDDLSKLDVEIPAGRNLTNITMETADSNKYYYACHGKKYCSAASFNQNMPSIEFSAVDLQDGFCISYGKSEMARNICKSIGPSSTKSWKPEDYYYIR
ncbi:MAG: prepilin-type N-terminal cleavage/methylation domain-containing protein [Elusimicrobiaceae bacterium]|nr:prepilin-type N-terminal cleavage/methylation domain-containing protein [Elusimicrobiaceae bacterium]